MSHTVQHVSWEEALGAHASGPVGGLQPHFVPRLQPEHHVSWWHVATSLINRETMQHVFAVKTQVHTSSTDEGRAEVAELIDTRDGARKDARLSAVMVLCIVDDLLEMKDFHWGWVLQAQADGKGRLWLWRVGAKCRQSRWTSRARGSYWTWRETKIWIATNAGKFFLKKGHPVQIMLFFSFESVVLTHI